ncbi:MAG: RES family NAD+ phosphorylase [Microbacteriaceae bacterium]|nr:RES family NAD+ phosphorylase [Microbacteriaceae bacterium]
MAKAITTVRGYVAQTDPGPVWRIGYAPDPWAWTEWAHATAGHFDGRWDSPAGEYRTVYAGSTYLACLIEVLARFRPDPQLVDIIGSILEDEVDAAIYSTSDAGTVPTSWFQARRVARAELTGSYCDVSHSSTIAALRPTFVNASLVGFGLADFDASALLNSGPRELTQAVGRFIYELPTDPGAAFDGVRFVSRHGTDLTLFAIFERSDDHIRSKHLSAMTIDAMDPTSTDVHQAMELLSLTIG